MDGISRCGRKRNEMKVEGSEEKGVGERGGRTNAFDSYFHSIFI